MKGNWSARSWWAWVGRLLIVAATVALARRNAMLLIVLFLPLAGLLMALGATRWATVGGPRPRPYRPRDPDAGRWLDAPVAELDKSTIGKLLTSRAGRDPSLHVVVPSRPTPTCTDALYDPELDG